MDAPKDDVADELQYYNKYSTYRLLLYSLYLSV